jgi:plasmid stability protein
MSKMIQVRNVPDEVHRTLKVRAAKEGMSLSEYLNRELRRLAERPTMEEFIERVRAAGPVIPREDSAAAVRAERDARR